ncbi:MAG TPA: S8 family serine peptidase [Solirubrobacteraceae bacterium]
MLVAVGAVGAVVGAVASGRSPQVRRASEHRAANAHPQLAVRGLAHSKLASGAASGGRVIVLLKQTDRSGRLAHNLGQRKTVEVGQQAPIVSSIKRSGGASVRKLTLVNAVAARVSSKEAKALASRSDVAQVIPDQQVTETVPLTPTASTVTPGPGECTNNPNKPQIEPEALQTMHFEGTGKDEAENIANGAGVVVAIEGMNELAGQPDFQRADGTHVVEDAPDYNPADIPNDGNLDEWFGDASSVAAQGTVTYQYSSELPFSNLPAGCTFVIKGDAPGATLVDLSLVDPAAALVNQDGQRMAQITQSESTIAAGIDNAVANLHADVISESYGSGGGSNFLWAVDDAAVAAGVTVTVSSGDEGFDNTFIAPADDPNVIGVGATTTLRLQAQAYGYPSWISDNIATLSSTGTGQPTSLPGAPGKYVDLTAPGYGGEVACSPLVPAGCPTNALTEAFGGTSESAPFVAGAAADVIEAYSNTHNGERPTPAMVKQILDGTASDINAPAGEQGAGEVNIYQAALAAEQEPFTTVKGDSAAPGLLSTPTQVDVSGAGGTTVPQSLSIYNASKKATKVTAALRQLGPAHQIGSTVTENVSAPAAGAAIPAKGAQAAAPVTFNVPKGVDRLNANMIWPDPTNSNILYYILTDPEGRLAQISYDFGAGGTRPTVPNIQHTEVTDPQAGTWTATILWGNGRSHLQEPPNVPGTYTGPMSFQVTRQSYTSTSLSGKALKVPARGSATLNVGVPLETTPGDHDMSIQLSGDNGATASVPVLARTVIPSTGGAFQAPMGTSVGRSNPENSLFFVDVPAGQQAMSVSLNTADASPDNTYSYTLFSPSGKEVVADATPTTTLQGVGSTTPTALANLSVADPAPGRWLIDIQLNLITSGMEFSQVVNGNVTFNNSGVTVLTGLPTSASTTLAQNTAQPVLLRVTNTTGVGRTFTFTSSQPAPADIAPVSAYIPAGVTQLVTLQLTPSAAPGTVVTGNLGVSTTTSAVSTVRRPVPNQSTMAILPYTYTAGPPAS